MSQYSLSTTDPLKRGSRDQARKIRLPWRADNGARKQRRYVYDAGEPSLIFDAGSIDTKSSRAASRAVWPRKHTRDVAHDGKTPTQDQFRAAVLGGVIFDSPPVSRAGTADSTGMRARLSGDHHVYSDASPLETPALSSSRRQRGWKIPSPLSVWARVPRGPADAGCEAQPPPVTPTTSTPSALTRVFGVLSRAMNR